MYSPSYNRVDDSAQVLDFVRENRFGVLVTTGPDGVPRATHLPFAFRGGADAAESEGWTLVAHLARANSQWEDFAGEREALVIFSGPHAYISPTHYERVLSVPTWNYIAVHAYGVPTVLAEPAAARAALDTLIAAEEPGYAERLAAYPDEFVAGMLRAIVAFEIKVSRVEARYKLSQDRTEGERQTIVAALSKSAYEAERNIAAAMDTAP